MLSLTWHKSSYSTHGNDDCVEVAVSSGGPVLYRESDRPGEIGRATGHTWCAFVRSIKVAAGMPAGRP
ncbi:DUF397 domain-containing protein [Streptomyces sp. NPDC007100]|uniref:DUF397 domain-containing protein n=1 Tax=Streptomyces sp. NPDC007100 TaxID=3155602 RepID=UPI0033FE6084